jgi:hypothetical protein
MNGELDIEKKVAEEKIMKRNGKTVCVGITQPFCDRCWGSCKILFEEAVVEPVGYEIRISDKLNLDNKITIGYVNLTDLKIDKNKRLWLTYIYEDVHITLTV